MIFACFLVFIFSEEEDQKKENITISTYTVLNITKTTADRRIILHLSPVQIKFKEFISAYPDGIDIIKRRINIPRKHEFDHEYAIYLDPDQETPELAEIDKEGEVLNKQTIDISEHKIKHIAYEVKKAAGHLVKDIKEAAKPKELPPQRVRDRRASVEAQHQKEGKLNQKMKKIKEKLAKYEKLLGEKDHKNEL